MSLYTVIGLYEDNLQRYAVVVDADSPAHAEVLALADADPELIIAGVIRGEVEVCA